MISWKGGGSVVVDVRGKQGRMGEANLVLRVDMVVEWR